MASGVEVGQAYVTVLPSAKGFGAALSSQINPAMATTGNKAGKGLSTSLLGGLKGVAGPMAALFAADKVIGFFSGAVKEARESQKVGAITANAIRATGGAAKISAVQVGDLATAISNKTGMDDETIQSGANMLLTFKNVRNELGKGNDVFNQATTAAADLSAAGFGSVEGASKTLGKALNDPIKGMAALGKTGVTFTDAQKAQVAAMVKTGDTLGAQKIIIGEVNSQVGGAAAASATAGEKLAVQWGNFKEQIGTALLPVLDKAMAGIGRVVSYLSANLSPAISRIGAACKAIGQALLPIFSSMATAITPVVTAVKNFAAGFSGAGGGASSFMAAFQPVIGFLTGQLIPGIVGVYTAMGGLYAKVIPIIAAFAQGMMARLGPLLPSIRIIFTTIGTIISTAMQLVSAIIGRVTQVISFIWANWGVQLMNVIGSIWGAIVGVVKPALSVIMNVIKLALAIVKGDWSGAWTALKGIVAGVWGVIKGIISGALGIIKAVLAAAWAVIKAGASAAWNGIKSVISSAGNAIKTTISATWTAVKAATVAAFNAVVSAITGGIGKAVAVVRSLPGKVVAALSGMAGTLKASGAALIQGLIDGITSKIRDVIAAASSVASAVKGFFPGSPVKDGPLTSWNNGGAGKRLGSMLASGLDASASGVASASLRLANSVASPTLQPATMGLSGGGSGGQWAGLEAAVERGSQRGSESGSQRGSENGIRNHVATLNDRDMHVLVQRGNAFGRSRGGGLR